MKQYLIQFILLASVFCHLSSVLAADAVVPASLTMNNVRDEAVDYATDAAFYQGATLRLTNCVMFAGTTTNSERQGLSEVAIQVTIGNTSTSAAYSGTAQVASNGTWSCDALVPSNIVQCYLQVKITDSSTNIYIYPWKILNHKKSL